MVPQLLLLAVAVTVVVASREDDVRQLLQQGDKLVMQGRSSYQEAIAKFTQAISLMPTNPKAYYRRAELYVMLKQGEKSVADLNRLLELEPHHKQGLQMRAKLLASEGQFAAAAADTLTLSEVLAAKGDAQKSAAAQDEGQKLRTTAVQWAEIQKDLNDADSRKASICKLPMLRDPPGSYRNVRQGK